MTPRRAVAEGPGVLAALTGALQNPSALVVGAALATLNNLLLVRFLGKQKRLLAVPPSVRLRPGQLIPA